MMCIRLCFGWLALTIIVYNAESWTYHYQTQQNMDWETARKWCQKHYTDMVAIQNHEEIAYLNRELPRHTTYYWIGIRKVKGQWTWVGTKKPLTEEAANWATNEPNNQGSGEDCVEIYIKRVADMGKWNDEKCRKKKAALCFKASCSNTTCGDHAECVESINNYTCKCEPGFTGPHCEEAVECGLLKEPAWGSVQCNHVYGEFRLNSSCQFHCAQGFTLQGSQNLHCLNSGDWDSGPPVCQAVQCPPILSATGGWSMNCSHPLDTYSYRSNCTFHCAEGFELVGSNKTQCDHTGKWTHNTPKCTVVPCGTLLTPPKGQMKCAHPLGEFSFSSSCTLSCEEGYKLRGENTLTCLKNGTWSVETPVCEVLRCSTLKSDPHGSVHCTDPVEAFSYGSTCWLECNLGFHPNGTNFTHCNSQGKWSHSLPVCKAVECLPIPSNSGGWSMNCIHPLEKNSYNSTCTFSCEEGFDLVGSNTTQCHHTGQWTHKTPTCTVLRCSTLKSDPHGSVHCTDPVEAFSYGSTCWLECNLGFHPNGTNFTHCNSQGKWSHSLPVCKAVECLPIPSNSGGWSMNCIHPLEKNSYNSTCTFSCEEGFEVVGSNTTQCHHTGQWTHKTPTCTALTCDPLVTPSNAATTCIDSLGKFSFNSSCTVSCDEGYTIKGENTVTCLKTGSWTAKIAACEVVSCGTLLNPSNGRMNCTHPLGEFSFRTSCTVHCEEGYTLRGEDTLTCLKTGTWSVKTPACEARQCPLLLTPEKGWMNCSQPHSFSYGTNCSFGCLEDYVLKGKATLDCTVNGSWSQKLPTCDVKEMPLGTSLLVYTAVGAGSSLGVLMAVGIIVLLVQQYTRKDSFTPDNTAWEGDLNPAFEEI
ncbi:P-selectin isoform X2 [Hoplias malabaricus]|uniref:P-selectin isoform X2 n=1 Tax=Hoplias malabaricus TaxID=27720 RepID=UPI0034635BDC